MVTENLYINKNCIVGQEYTDANQYLKNKKRFIKKTCGNKYESEKRHKKITEKQRKKEVERVKKKNEKMKRKEKQRNEKREK